MTTIIAENDRLSSQDMDIDALLLEAENRLRENANALVTAKSSSAMIKSLLEAIKLTVMVVQSVPKLNYGVLPAPYIKANVHGPSQISDKARSQLMVVKEEKAMRAYLKVDDPVKVKKVTKEKKDTSTGPDWFNMPKPEITPAIKRDLQMIKLRNVLDPHKHFKKDDSKELPKFFQMGTLVEGNTEFYSARLKRKDRKKSMVDEVMASSESRSRFRKKYNEIQAKKTSGKKDFYKKMKAKRRKTF